VLHIIIILFSQREESLTVETQPNHVRLQRLAHLKVSEHETLQLMTSEVHGVRCLEPFREGVVDPILDTGRGSVLRTLSIGSSTFIKDVCIRDTQVVVRYRSAAHIMFFA
jgi:hypothetical protein